MKTKSPCDRQCPERMIGCHATCAKYIEFWKICEKERRRRAMEAGNRNISPGLRKALVRKMSRIRQGREK